MPSYLDTVLYGMVTAEETSLSEAYAMLLAAGFTNEEVGKSMGGWNKEELEGPLVEEAVTVLRKARRGGGRRVRGGQGGGQCAHDD